ncbi:hypothetical protein Syun_021708 [Stephania yunnanensis]|uniref:Uncharacterized protein n=1 Tax=Stephania yunnanensis TaxID=152371 RepID=A0AAP0NSI2_9MAGN
MHVFFPWPDPTFVVSTVVFDSQPSNAPSAHIGDIYESRSPNRRPSPDFGP